MNLIEAMTDKFGYYRNLASHNILEEIKALRAV